MDTHIASSPDLDRHDLQLSARLPNEPDLDDTVSAEPAAREKLAPVQSAPRNKNRGILLGGVAVVAVLAVAGSAFVLSPYNNVVPVPARVAAAVHHIERDVGFKSEAPLAPAASLASVAMPQRPTSVEVPKYQARPREENLSEILAMRPGALAQAVPTQNPERTAKVATSVAPNGFVPHEPGTMAVPSSIPSLPVPATPTTVAAGTPEVAARGHQPNDITAAIIRAAEGHPETALEAALPSPTVPAAPMAPVKAVEPPATPVQPAVAVTAPASDADATSRAQRLLAGPMTSDEQVKVLELVTQMATIVHDQKAQIGALRADFAKTKLDDQARLADFARRVDMAEATRAVAAASGSEALAAPAAAPSANNVAVRPATAMAPIAITRADVAVPTTQEAKHYRVQAASPGLALLSEVERGGGDGAQVQVIVGGSIPGYGRVKSIAQIGSSWAVRTENGDIR